MADIINGNETRAIPPATGSANGMSALTESVRMEIGMNRSTRDLIAMAESKPPVITEADIKRAIEILKKYKDGKAFLEAKIIANEEFFKQRQWKYYIEDAIVDPNDPNANPKAKRNNRFEPATPWLFSCIQSRYSDVMDSYPTCNIQPRQKDDKGEAKKLSQIIPIILEQNDYEETYSDVAWYTLIQGGGIQAVMWDGQAHNGLGDIKIKKADFLNLFWEGGVTDIQKSPNLFYTELVDRELIISKYPQAGEALRGGKPIALSHYVYDDHVDTTDKCIVVDWYYKKVVNGKLTLQYVKFVDDILLYATENDNAIPTKQIIDPETGITVEVPYGEPIAMRGLYDHAMYPFVVQPLFPIEGSLCGYGLTDIGRDTQMEIDLLNQAITENALWAAKPRYFFKDDGTVNESDFSDISKGLVKVKGSLNDEAMRVIECKQLAGIYVDVINQKIEELKYCTSNQDSNNGIAPSGITAASAISALQETAGKNARSANKAFHRAYKEVVYMVIELIRQFYDTPRVFRLAPDALGQEQFVEFSNAGILPQKQTGIDGSDMGYRVPEFDISVTTEKANPYKKMEMNELALSFYGNGFFNPQMATQAQGALEMMDFEKKDEIVERIQQNGTLYEQLLQYQQIALQLAARVDPQMANELAKDIQMRSGQPVMNGLNASLPVNDSNDEHPYVERARSQARESTQAD